jgi:hypothetical protein
LKKRMNLDRRLRKLESGRRIDASGLVPRSDAWFTYWEDKFDRSVNGENVECAGFPLAVIDRLVEAADRDRMAA